MSKTGFRNGDLFCFNCGTSQKMPLPMPVQLATDFMKSFEKLHKDCEKTWTEPKNETSEKSEIENALWWLKNGEQGISSKTMFKYLSDDNIPLNINSESHPLDPDDFKRCYKLLKAVPQFKVKLGRMRNISTTWANLVDNWDKLTEMYEENVRTEWKNYKKIGMYEFMKSLGC